MLPQQCLQLGSTTTQQHVQNVYCSHIYKLYCLKKYSSFVYFRCDVLLQEQLVLGIQQHMVENRTVLPTRSFKVLVRLSQLTVTCCDKNYYVNTSVNIVTIENITYFYKTCNYFFQFYAYLPERATQKLLNPLL